MIIYEKYFIASGIGEDNVSKLNAFDNALMEAGISESNLVTVSSILPENCFEVKKNPGIKIGEIVHCVLARMDGVKGEMISAGVACVRGESNGKKYGLVAEAKNHVDKEELKNILEKKIDEMCKIRNFNIKDLNIIVNSIPKINKNFGCVIVAVVYR